MDRREKVGGGRRRTDARMNPENEFAYVVDTQRVDAKRSGADCRAESPIVLRDLGNRWSVVGVRRPGSRD